MEQIERTPRVIRSTPPPGRRSVPLPDGRILVPVEPSPPDTQP